MMVAQVLLVVALSSAPISIDYQGSLGEALKQIAQKGDINLVMTGDVNVQAQVHLKNVSAEEALTTLAKVYRLEVHKEGKLWVVKPQPAGEAIEVIEALQKNAAANHPPLAPPMPPMPPMPVAGSTTDDEGNKVSVGTDGSTVIVGKDGSKVSVAADGSTVSVSPDGTRVSVGADGSSVTVLPDGRKLSIAADGTKISVEKDGTKITETPDGRKRTESANGKTVNISKNEDSDDLEDQAEAARDRAEEARDRAQEARDRAQEMRDRAHELRDARHDRDQAAADEVRARVEEAKAHRDLDKGDGEASAGPVVVKAGETASDVVSYGGSVTIEDGATVEGDAVSFGGDVVLGDGAVVTGDAVSFGGQVRKGDGAMVKGQEVSFGSKGLGISATRSMLKTPVVKAAAKDGREPTGSRVGQFLLQFAALFGLGFLLMMFAPARMRNIEAEIRQQPVKSGLAGLLGLLAAIPVTVVMCLTVIGIPFALVLWLVAGIGILMGLLALANTLGARLPIGRRRRTQAVVMAVGLFAMMLVAQIPVLGGLLVFVATFVSAGAIIRTRIGQRQLGFPVPDPMMQDIGERVP